ncbi:hypothetical protein MUP77_03365 [Candidatus Bathyarchaeota archaeon]|nr:hypothetical protein [Candidatus Bathyarchaeota archaeon]
MDDVIRKDFEDMPSHLFKDKYRDVLVKYVAFLANINENTTSCLIATVKAYFTSEALSIALQRGKIPRKKMVKGKHRFTLPDLKNMWLIADIERKARLSTAVSLGWSIGDFMALETAFIKRLLDYTNQDGFFCVSTKVEGRRVLACEES